jgi:hypothetical protein
MHVKTIVAEAILIAWVPVVAALFRVLGPRRATLMGLIGGLLFLPPVGLQTPPPIVLQIVKVIVSGAGVALGILLFDRRTLLKARPRLQDGAMAAFVLYPLTGLLACGWTALSDVCDMIMERTLGWGVAYFAGRLYFSDRDGPRRVAAGVVIATLCLAPVCLFETVMGPKWYLSGLLFGTPYLAHTVVRLGGWRPEAFFNNGVMLASWMAMATSLAFWLWLGGSWRPRRGPAWWPTLVLLIATIACHGVYGYIDLAIGLAAAALTLALRTRAVLVALAVIPLVYMTLRGTGQWDGHELVELAGKLQPGKESTVSTRVDAETQTAAAVIAHHAALFGFGNHIHNVEALGIKPPWTIFPDGRWVQVFWEGGVVGLAIYLLALHFVPVGLALWWPRGRPRRPEASSPAWGLALFTLILLIDFLHNVSLFPPTALLAGSMVGWSRLGRAASARAEARAEGGHERRRDSSRKASRIAPEEAASARDAGGLALLAPVAAQACVLYVFGHGPVSGQGAVKTVGGLGAGLLFAVAGGVGAWAGSRFSPARVAVYALLFAALGVSFNLALHPGTRPAASADILQGMALCGLVVAGWRRLFGANALADSFLAVAALVIHVILGGMLPEFPGSQYLCGGSGGEEAGALFPVFPWLALAVLGARAARENATVNLIAAGLFGTAAALLVWSDIDSPGFVKIPMNLPYALLACTAVCLGFAFARPINARELIARPARWLGQQWLVFFYVHFAVVAVLDASTLRSPWIIWPLTAAGSIGATWLAAKVSEPLQRVFEAPGPWLLLLVTIALAAGLPRLSRTAVLAVSGFAGLVFATRYRTLATCLLSARPARLWHPQAWFVPGARLAEDRPRRHAHSKCDDSRREPEPPDEWDREPPGRFSGAFWPNLARFLLVLALLSSPEILSALTATLSPRTTAPADKPRQPLAQPPLSERPELPSEAVRPSDPLDSLIGKQQEDYLKSKSDSR